MRIHSFLCLGFLLLAGCAKQDNALFSGIEAGDVAPTDTASGGIPDTSSPPVAEGNSIQPNDSNEKSNVNSPSNEGSGKESAENIPEEPADNAAENLGAGDAIAAKPAAIAISPTSMTDIISQLGKTNGGSLQVSVAGGLSALSPTNPQANDSNASVTTKAAERRVHLFARVTNDLMVSPSNYLNNPSVLLHAVSKAPVKETLWKDQYEYQFFPAPGGMSLDESPAVTQTEKGFHAVSRSGESLIYWQCASGLNSKKPSIFDCKTKVLSKPELTGVKAEGCAAITSDPFGGVHIFVKNGDSQRIGYFSGQDFDSIKLTAASLKPSANYQPESCMSAAYHPLNKKIYLVSRGEDGWALVLTSSAISSPEQKLGQDSFDVQIKAVGYKFNGGLSSCGENGRVTLLFDPSEKKLVSLHHEDGGQDTVIVTTGYENLPNGPLPQTQIGSTFLDSVDIDDYPVGAFDDNGALHVYADKAHEDRLFEGFLKNGSSDAWAFAGPPMKVERAPGMAFDSVYDVLHVFMRKWGTGNPIVHYAKPASSKTSGQNLPLESWDIETLTMDGSTHFEGCPTAIYERQTYIPVTPPVYN